jgi:DNA-binding protein HU-beta
MVLGECPVRKPVKPSSASKRSSRAAPAKRAAASKAAKSSASKIKAAKSKTTKTKPAKTKPAKTKKSAKAKPGKKTAAVSTTAKGCCIIKYTDGREEARNGLTRQQCHDIEISSQAVAATHWQSGVCA